jgi:predicted nucleic acid-binding protein
MTLVDTSVWIDHLQKGNSQLEKLLNENNVLIHPFIIGEVSLGIIKNREEILGLLNELPLATVANHEEVLTFIEINELIGSGIGWIDAHLLASMRISNAYMLTTDKAMLNAMKKLGK